MARQSTVGGLGQVGQIDIDPLAFRTIVRYTYSRGQQWTRGE